MCLGIPGRITALNDDGLLPQGVIDFGGTTREVCLAYTPDAGVGDWVLVHVGFAISQLSEQEAAQTLADLKTLAEANGLADAPGPEAAT
jgi:hydrogenase expression/formation protein HypC